MLLEALAWRAEHKIDSVLDEPWPPGASGELLSKSFCHHGTDASGAPLFVFRPGYLHLELFQRELTSAQLVRFGVRCLETVRLVLLRQTTEQSFFSVLLDLEHSEVVLVRRIKFSPMEATAPRHLQAVRMHRHDGLTHLNGCSSSI